MQKELLYQNLLTLVPISQTCGQVAVINYFGSAEVVFHASKKALDTIEGFGINSELANGYNKDVFAFPGRTDDTKSAGLQLPDKNKSFHSPVNR
jgi:hypothetical protein